MIQVLLFLNNAKDLDPSYKMDLDFRNCFGRGKKLHLFSKEIRYMYDFQAEEPKQKHYAFSKIYFFSEQNICGHEDWNQIGLKFNVTLKFKLI